MCGRENFVLLFFLDGLTPFLRGTTWQFFSRSHQIEQPVKPRWPTERGENKLPLADFPGVGVSQPSAKLASAGPLRVRNSCTSVCDRKLSFPLRHRLRRSKKACTSRAEEKSPAWPATPPMA